MNRQTLDFYLPDYRIGIECQGQQHFSPVDFGNKGNEYVNKRFEKIKLYDQNKYNLCLKEGVEVLYYCSEDNRINNIKYIGEIFSDRKKLVFKIKGNKK